MMASAGVIVARIARLVQLAFGVVGCLGAFLEKRRNAIAISSIYQDKISPLQIIPGLQMDSMFMQAMKFHSTLH